MPDAVLRFRNAAQFEEMLKSLGPKIANRLGDQALKAGAKVIVDEARRLCPKAKHRGRHLRESIVAVKGVGDRSDERKYILGFRPPKSRIAHLLEFGTSKMSAQPFMRPAMDGKAQESLNAMADSLAKGISTKGYESAFTVSGDD